MAVGVGALFLAAGGCVVNFGLSDGRSSGIESEVRAADRYAQESRTLSHLAAVETAVADYVKNEGKIPAKLDLLVPKYLAEIPALNLTSLGHRETNQVRYYSTEIIRDGVVDGSRIKDTGRWGYVYNNLQVIVFVDCTHASSRGKPWYQERGVF